MRESLMQEIMERVPRKPVLSNCKKVLKKMSPKSSTDLNYAADLAAWLYVYGEEDYALRVCALLEPMEFTGNYTVWSNMQNTRALKAHILRSRGDDDGADRQIGVLRPHEHPELYKKSDTLDYWDRNIDSAIREGYKPGIRDWKLIKLKVAIKQLEVELPISTEVYGTYGSTRDYLEQEIAALKAELATY